MELRPYQKDCVDKIIWSKNTGLEGNELVVLPTGAGKSVVIAHLADQLKEPILILQPTKEILEQNYSKLIQYVDEDKIGIYSASMGEKEVGYYTLATIQSIYTKPEFFSHYAIIFIDEAHLLNPKSMGMFMGFIKKINQIRERQGKKKIKVIGFTATPYRMDSMYIGWGTPEVRVVTTIKLVNRMKGFFWSRILYNINTQELVDMGYLCPLEYVDYSIVEHSQIPTNKSKSDFDLNSFEKIISDRKQRIIDAINYGKNNAKSILIFCSSIAQAKKFSEITEDSAMVTGATPKKEREKIISDFKNGTTKVVFNVGVLTTGFDHPALDCIILLRPTRSIALYYQMLGRGVRIAEGKKSCKVIDLTSNVKSLGRVETIKLVKRDKWELESETGSWHGSELYSFTMNLPQFNRGKEQPQITVVKDKEEEFIPIDPEDVPF